MFWKLRIFLIGVTDPCWTSLLLTSLRIGSRTGSLSLLQECEVCPQVKNFESHGLLQCLVESESFETNSKVGRHQHKSKFPGGWRRFNKYLIFFLVGFAWEISVKLPVVPWEQSCTQAYAVPVGTAPPPRAVISLAGVALWQDEYRYKYYASWPLEITWDFWRCLPD